MYKLNLKTLFKHKRKLLNSFLIACFVLASVVVSFPTIQTVYIAAATERKLPIYSVDIDTKKVAMSFDAAWGADDTDRLLGILEENDVKTTFFLCGYWIDKYPEEVKRIYEAGHDIGNHGNTHAHGAQLSLEQNKSEINGVHEKINKLLGIDINLFRPPYGEYNNTVIEAAEDLGYYTIQWDVESLDTKVKYKLSQYLIIHPRLIMHHKNSYHIQ